MININTIVFKFGFEYKGVRYGWHKKNLYRLPFVSSNNKNYDLKVIYPFVIGSTLCYNIQRDKLTINRLKGMTVATNWEHELIIEDDCPF